MTYNPDRIEKAICAAEALPPFPAQQEIIRCLETRNVNGYGRALELLNELEHDPAAASALPPEIRTQLRHVADLVRGLEAADRAGE